MANITITNNDNGSVVLKCLQDRDAILAVAAADTIAEGTILARREVATAITAVAGAGDTGDGTCTAVSVYGGYAIPKVGDYNLECTGAVANGGVFKLEDPDGIVVAEGLTMTAGAGAATTFTGPGFGMTFILTDGAADFIVGDSFALTVVIDGDLVPYDIDGIGGANRPMAVLTYDVVTTAAADVAITAMIDGTVRKQRLIVDADGDDSNLTEAILDELRAAGIVATDVDDISELDNQ